MTALREATFIAYRAALPTIPAERLCVDLATLRSYCTMERVARDAYAQQLRVAIATELLRRGIRL